MLKLDFFPPLVHNSDDTFGSLDASQVQQFDLMSVTAVRVHDNEGTCVILCGAQWSSAAQRKKVDQALDTHM